jgi:ABC-type bacteriocin/lantibiotic exporter with double-glycine peptidase domain
MGKMNYQTLTATISVDTLQLLFKEELDFITTHRWLFLEQHSEIIFSLDGITATVEGSNRVIRGGLSVGQLMAVRGMRENVRQQEEQEKKIADFNATL